MRTLFYVTVIFIFLTSCKKSTSSNNTPPEQTISYKRNGTYKEFKTNDDKFKITNATVNAFPPYTLMYGISAAPNSDEFISLLLISSTTSQLVVGDYYCQYPIQYTQPGGATVRFPVARAVIKFYSTPTTYVEKEYEDKAGDFSQVKITKIQNGYVSGTFSASMTYLYGTEKLIITEGTFTNFKMN